MCKAPLSALVRYARWLEVDPGSADDSDVGRYLVATRIARALRSGAKRQ
jgi:hypothetical protein